MISGVRPFQVTSQATMYHSVHLGCVLFWKAPGPCFKQNPFPVPLLSQIIFSKIPALPHTPGHGMGWRENQGCHISSATASLHKEMLQCLCAARARPEGKRGRKDVGWSGRWLREIQLRKIYHTVAEWVFPRLLIWFICQKHTWLIGSGSTWHPCFTNLLLLELFSDQLLDKKWVLNVKE